MDKTRAQVLLTQAQDQHRQGDHKAALASITPVIKTYANPGIWDLYGDILLALGDIESAAHAYRQAVAGEPTNAGYHHDLARALISGQQADAAETSLRTAAQLNPQAWDIMCDLGTAQLEQGKPVEAIASFSASIKLHPGAHAAHFNLGTALRELDRLEEAEAAFRASLGLAPSFVPPMISLITLLADSGRLDEALHWHDQAIRLAPHDPQVRQARAMALLRHGHLRDGFMAYESRLQPTRLTPPPRPFPQAYWQGEDLSGKRILLWTEQGVGDEIFAAGMFDAVIAKAAHCTIECTARVVPLLRRSFPAATVTVRRDPPDSVLTAAGAFDYQTAALSLCRLLRTDFSEFPAHRGYLRPDPQRVEALRAKYRAMKPGALVIGISWDSSGRHGVHKRLPLQHWTPILAQENALFVSLQYGAQSDTLGLVVDHDIDPLQDLDAAAAQVAAMDLVITVSNTTAHLAGAMNVPVWTLLPKGTGCLWYWFMDRDDSPWYPAMRLFRQPERGQWTTVIADAARALVEFIAKRRV